MEKTTEDYHKKLNDIKTELIKLKELATMFNRWHESMYALLEQNKTVQQRNKQLEDTADMLRVVSLNARIVAGRASNTNIGNVFKAVANEMTKCVDITLNISESYLAELNKNELITVNTFQDVQAGGRVITAKIHELLNNINDLSEK